MPIRCEHGGKARYRWKRMKNGTKVRLAFCGNEVVETKTLHGKPKRVERKRRRARVLKLAMKKAFGRRK